MAEESGSRTHKGPSTAPTGFEVRPPHRGRFSSLYCKSNRMSGAASAVTTKIYSNRLATNGANRHSAPERLCDMIRRAASFAHGIDQFAGIAGANGPHGE